MHLRRAAAATAGEQAAGRAIGSATGSPRRATAALTEGTRRNGLDLSTFCRRELSRHQRRQQRLPQEVCTKSAGRRRVVCAHGIEVSPRNTVVITAIARVNAASLWATARQLERTQVPPIRRVRPAATFFHQFIKLAHLIHGFRLLG
jgi:hypothetical protein